MRGIIKARVPANNIEINNLDLMKYRQSEDSYKKSIKQPKTIEEKDLNKLYACQKIFWKEELKHLCNNISNSKIERIAGKMAFDITVASDAFSKYIDEKEQNAMQFSCHPKNKNSSKIGI